MSREGRFPIKNVDGVMTNLSEIRQEDPIYPKNAEIIWDTGFSYELGFFVGTHLKYDLCEIKLKTGPFQNIRQEILIVPRDQILFHTTENFNLCMEKYGVSEDLRMYE